MSGWIKLHREILNWEWYSHINTRVVFLHCILRANYEDTIWRGIPIKRGQFIASMNTLSNEIGISVKSVRTAFDNLKRSNDVVTNGQTQFTVFTVVNYDMWQTEDEQQTTQKGKRQDSKRTTDKEVRSKEERIVFSFRKSLVDLDIPENIVDDFLKVREKKKAANTETAFKLLVEQIKKSGKTPTECITICVDKSWKGFKSEWITEKQTLFSEIHPEIAFTPKTGTYSK